MTVLYEQTAIYTQAVLFPARTMYHPLRLATWAQDCITVRISPSDSIACMNDVASLMRLVNTGIELRNCPYLSLLQEKNQSLPYAFFSISSISSIKGSLGFAVVH